MNNRTRIRFYRKDGSYSHWRMVKNVERRELLSLLLRGYVLYLGNERLTLFRGGIGLVRRLSKLQGLEPAEIRKEEER